MSHVSSLLGRILSIKRQERRDPRRFLDAHSWKNRIRQRFQKVFLGKSDANLDQRTEPWCRLFDAEPEHSKYNAERFLAKYLQMTEAANSIDYLSRSQAFAQFRRESNLAFGGRRLMRTDGGLLGLGPTHMCEGDQVCILAGAKTPVVLRRLDNGHYQFLGEAYVHGIMHGEATDLISEPSNLTLE